MRDLRLQLDDTDFAQLIETARALIPTLAPTWTDHNIHDPGITLLDLTAWTAEAQIYSLARMRRDERAAYGALVGVRPTGPVATSGLIWPRADVTALGAGVSLPAGVVLRGARGNVPDISLQHATFLTGARLTRVTAVLGDGSVRDWTRSNLQEAASFAAFGDTRTGAAELTLHFSGRLANPELGITPGHALSLGVRIAGSTASAVAAMPAVGLQATLQAGRRSYRLPLQLDTTDGLLHTGVLLLDLSALEHSVVDDFSITLRSSGGDFVRAPQIVRIVPNVLLVVGRKLAIDEAAAWSTAFPNQRFTLRQAGLQFGPGVPEPAVEISTEEGFEPWQAVTDLSLQGPQDRVYSVDRARATLVFGNGINGAIPALGATLRVGYWISAGALGNVPRNMQWRVSGLAGIFGTNPEALSGGLAATTLEDLQRAARARIRNEYPLVTMLDLEQAALALPDLAVARARELPDLGPVCGFDELSGVRTLVVLAARAPMAPDAPTENASWLAEVARRSSVRLPLGQRLRVIAPEYLPVRVRVRLRARPQTDPEQLRHTVLTELRKRFALTGAAAWPFERDVKRLDVLGWLRKVPGVAAIAELQLLLRGQPVADGIAVHGRALPQLAAASDDVMVERSNSMVRS